MHRKFRSIRQIFLLVSALFIAKAVGYSQQNAQEGKNKQAVQVFMSSPTGDRLAQKPEVFFSLDTSKTQGELIVDENHQYQLIDGFGATFNEAGMICLNALTTDAKQKVLTSLFDSLKGAGFTLMKSPMASCDFTSAGPWYSYNEVPGDTAMQHFSIRRDLGLNGLVNFIRAASQHGHFEIETTMDFPPDWMLISLKRGERHVRPEYYHCLATYYLKYLQAYQAQGISINYLNPFNEAQNSWYSNMNYTEIRDLVKSYLGPMLKETRIPTHIQLCETASRPEGIEKLPAALDDPACMKYVSTLTVHGYDWNQFSTLTALHEKYPSLPIWMTEVCYADPHNIPPGGPKSMPVYSFLDGAFWGNMIANDLKHWVGGWIYWNMILDERGGPWLVSEEHGDSAGNRQHPVVIINRKTREVTYTGLYYYLAHFSKFVRPGARRIQSTCENSMLNCVAFFNQDGWVVVNVINNGSETICKVKNTDKYFVQKLPAHSITTFRWKKSAV